MLIEENDTYKIYGKTGWSVSEGHDNGWFVGYIETQKKVYFFATNIEPKEHFDMAMFLSMRKEVTYRAFEKMGILKCQGNLFAELKMNLVKIMCFILGQEMFHNFLLLQK